MNNVQIMRFCIFLTAFIVVLLRQAGDRLQFLEELERLSVFVVVLDMNSTDYFYRKDSSYLLEMELGFDLESRGHFFK